MKPKIIIIAGLTVIAGYVIVMYWKKKWYKINAPFGKKLGYPDCCIKEFCDQPPQLLKLTSANETDRLRYQAGCINGQFTGFIPCSSHAKSIMDGKLTIESLIKNRDEKFPPFPNL